jgi:hypothetical protein
MESALRIWAGENVTGYNHQPMSPGGYEDDDVDERVFGSMNQDNNLSFNLELLSGALIDVDGWANVQSNHQSAETEVIGD